ncbi:MAG: class I SAM-dependent methyltransferase [Candidatus Krumholzibacteriales bacterium]
MKDKVYQDMVNQQRNHWWFRARRNILGIILEQFAGDGSPDILEIGCGTGGNLPMLKSHGGVSAVEMDDFAIRYAEELTGVEVLKGWLPDSIPYRREFDMVCMFDVLEHIKDDRMALKEIYRLMRPDGLLIITVPAYSWLFGTHDRLLRHFRRYSRKKIKRLVLDSGFSIEKLSYFNTFLFPMAVLARVIDMFRGGTESLGYSTPPEIINRPLFAIFNMEKYILGRHNLPFGTSVLAVCRKTPGSTE